jgi:hypothetical protein
VEVTRNSDGYPSRQSRLLLPESCERFCPLVDRVRSSFGIKTGWEMAPALNLEGRRTRQCGGPPFLVVRYEARRPEM